MPLYPANAYRERGIPRRIAISDAVGIANSIASQDKRNAPRKIRAHFFSNQRQINRCWPI